LNTANKHRHNVLQQIYGGPDSRSSAGKSGAYYEGDYGNLSSSKLNKSVTFNNQVRVREYGGVAGG
jgi:hypothetical protein